jgi:hypothetical protein
MKGQHTENRQLHTPQTGGPRRSICQLGLQILSNDTRFTIRVGSLTIGNVVTSNAPTRGAGAGT